MRLLFAGILTLIAGVISTAPNTWVVAVVGGAMIGVACYQHQLQLAALRARSGAHRHGGGPTHSAERITRERWRETRERR